MAAYHTGTTTYDYVPTFSGTVDNVISGTFNIPYDWKFETPLHVQIFWAPSSNTGNVSWTFTYSVCTPGSGTSTTGTPVTTVIGNLISYDTLRKTTVATISTTGNTLDGGAYTFTLKRNGSTDTFNGTVALFGWMVNYCANRWGSYNDQ